MAETAPGGGVLSVRSRLTWSADGKRILDRTWTDGPNSGESETRFVVSPVDGGDLVRLGLSGEEMFTPDLHPDGRRICFIAGSRRSEIWVMEGLR